MGQPVTILNSTHIWPTTGDTGYSAEALQIIQLLATAVLPIEGLYNPNTGQVGNIGIDDNGNLTINGLPIGTGSVTSVAIASPTDIQVSGSPITSTGTITLDLAPTGVLPGSYTLSNLTVDSKGRITSISNGAPPAGGTVTSVAATGLQGVTTNVLNPTSTPNIQIGLGDITPTSVNIQGGNLTLTGANQRIIGDFSSGVGVKTTVQTSVSNGATNFGLAPNGTGTQSSFITRNSSDFNNTGSLLSTSTAVEHFIGTGVVGSAANLPLRIKSNGVTGITVNTDATVTIPTTLTVTGPITGSNISGTNTGNQTITATGDATGVSTGAPATSLPLTLANSGVAPGSYVSANITVDAKGRITSAANGSQGVWGGITGDITNQTDLNDVFTMIGNVTIGTGVTTTTDTVGLIALNDTTVRLKPTQQAVFSALIPSGLADADRTFPQQDYALANLTFPSDGIYVRFIGVDTNGLVVTSPVSFKTSPNVLQYGYLLVKQVGGVKTFLDGAAGPRNVFTWPDFAGNNAAESEYFTPITSVIINPNANLTVKNSSGVIKGLNINWGTANVNERAILSQNPTTFTTINPSTALAASLPAPGTAVQVSQYWNGTAMVALGGPNVSSVQRFFVTINGGLFLQVGEASYANFATAIDNISVAPFTNIIPEESFIEIVRFASRSGSTNLSVNSDAVFQSGNGNGGGGGGSSAGTVTSINIAGANGVTATGGPITSSGSITVGLGVITPTSISTGQVVVAGNLSMSGNGRKIIGEMNSATLTDRLAFQTVGLNANTSLTVIPNGTGTGSGIDVYDNSAVGTSRIGSLRVNATGFNSAPAVQLLSTSSGAALAPPLTISTGTNLGLVFDTSGNVIQGPLSYIPSNATAGFFNLGAVSGTPTGTPAALTGFTANSKAAMTVDAGTGDLYVYANSSWRKQLSGDVLGTPGSFTNANITVNAEGRITAASNGTSGTGTVTSVGITSTTLNSTGGPITTNGNIAVDLLPQASAGTYTSANITVDGFGRVTAASSGSGGTLPAGADTQVQFNSGGSFGADPAFTWTGTGLGLGNNLNFSGLGRRLLAPMSDATISNRFAIQNATPGSSTVVSVLPSAATNTSGINFYLNSDPNNSSYAGMFMFNNIFNGQPAVYINSGARGSGTVYPMILQAGLTSNTFDTLGNSIFGTTTGLNANSTNGFMYIGGVPSHPTGIPQYPAGFPVGVKTPFTIDNSNGHFWSYAAGTWHDPTVMEQNIQTVDYTTVYTDGSKQILHPSADPTPRTFTIATGASGVSYLVGTKIEFANEEGAGNITLTSGDTLVLTNTGTTGPITIPPKSNAVARKISATRWQVTLNGIISGGGGGSTAISALTNATSNNTLSTNGFEQVWELGNRSNIASLYFKDTGSGGQSAILIQAGASQPLSIFDSTLTNELFSVSQNGAVQIGGTTGGLNVNAAGDIIFAVSNSGYSFEGPTSTFLIDNTGAFLLNANTGSTGQVLTSQGPGVPPTWTNVSGGGGIPEAPVDGNGYIRKNAAWVSTIDGGTY